MRTSVLTALALSLAFASAGCSVFSEPAATDTETSASVPQTQPSAAGNTAEPAQPAPTASAENSEDMKTATEPIQTIENHPPRQNGSDFIDMAVSLLYRAMNV